MRAGKRADHTHCLTQCKCHLAPRYTACLRAGEGLVSIRAMVATRDDLFNRLDALGIVTKTVEHPTVFTVDEAKAARGDLAGSHSKNLFLKDKKGRMWLVVTLEDRAVDTKALRKAIGAAQLSFGKPELLKDVLGIDPGSVTPFAVINDTGGQVSVILDAGLLASEPLNFHPLVNTATTSISTEDLVAFLRDTGHDPVVLDFTDLTRET